MINKNSTTVTLISSVITETLTSPLRVLLIEDQARGDEFSAHIKVVSDRSNLNRTTILDVIGFSKYSEIMRETFVEDGYTGFFKGTGIEILFVPLEVFSNLYVAKFLKNIRGLTNNIPTSMPQLVSQVMLYPLETIQTRLITQNKKQYYEGLFDCARMIHYHEGFFAFWKGYASQAVESFIVVAFAEILRRSVSRVVKGDLSSVIAYNIVLSLVTNPLTVIKRKMQADRTKEYKDSLDCAKSIIHTEGLLGLYRGAPLSLVYNVVNGTVASYVSTYVADFFNSDIISNVSYLTNWVSATDEQQRALEKRI
jgi:hypothetical protein